jgi:serine/threonine protein phosphatase 1
VASGRLLVLGDVHGAHRALVQVLVRAGFDRERDRLVFLGDVADGWFETRRCIDELLAIPHLVHLLGNHDDWFLRWLQGAAADVLWLTQGGWATLESYGIAPVPLSPLELRIHLSPLPPDDARAEIPATHRDLLRRAKLWHEDDGRMFVHGGWPWHRSPHPLHCRPEELLWDRSLWDNAFHRAANGRTRPLTAFREVYLGHTTTTRCGHSEPVQRCEVWNLDQGAGWEGRLSLMDVDTKEFWQSDPVETLYPEVANARKRR